MSPTILLIHLHSFRSGEESEYPLSSIYTHLPAFLHERRPALLTALPLPFLVSSQFWILFHGSTLRAFSFFTATSFSTAWICHSLNWSSIDEHLDSLQSVALTSTATTSVACVTCHCPPSQVFLCKVLEMGLLQQRNIRVWV